MRPLLRTVKIVALHTFRDLARPPSKADLLELTGLPVDGGPRALGNVFGSTTDPFIQDGLRRAWECGTGIVTIELTHGWQGPLILSAEEVEVIT